MYTCTTKIVDGWSGPQLATAVHPRCAGNAHYTGTQRGHREVIVCSQSSVGCAWGSRVQKVTRRFLVTQVCFTAPPDRTDKRQPREAGAEHHHQEQLLEDSRFRRHSQSFSIPIVRP